MSMLTMSVHAAITQNKQQVWYRSFNILLFYIYMYIFLRKKVYKLFLTVCAFPTCMQTSVCNKQSTDVIYLYVTKDL